MKTQDAIQQFGSVRKIAEALGLSVQAIYAWGDEVPKLRVYELREIRPGAFDQQDQKQAA
jgi:hypothetical protein